MHQAAANSLALTRQGEGRVEGGREGRERKGDVGEKEGQDSNGARESEHASIPTVCRVSTK